MTETERCRKIPWQKNRAESIIPIFLPFFGCKTRCFFCAQDVQTGSGLASEEMDMRLKLIAEQLLARRQKEPVAPKIGFYGGTFTALAENLWQKCLNFARNMQKLKLASQFSCSTRPDYLSVQRVQELKSAGCFRIELGIQSLNEKALFAARRPYTLRDIEQSVNLVKSAGLECGAQLMPGFPFADNGGFLADLQQCLKWGIKIFRIYPCIVFANTELARLYQNGLYNPLGMVEAIEVCAQSLLLVEEQNARIIRTGILITGNDKSHILAGPYDESFGSRVMALALYKKVKKCLKKLESHADILLYLPAYCQGFFWGWKGELKAEWQKLNISANNVKYWNESEIKIVF